MEWQKNCAFCSPPRTWEKTVLVQGYCLTVPGCLLAMAPLCWWSLHCSKGQKWFLISCCHTCSVQLLEPSGRKFFQYSSWQVSEMEYSQNYCTNRASVLFWKHYMHINQKNTCQRQFIKCWKTWPQLKVSSLATNLTVSCEVSSWTSNLPLLTNFSWVDAPLPTCTAGQILLFLNCQLLTVLKLSLHDIFHDRSMIL